MTFLAHDSLLVINQSIIDIDESSYNTIYNLQIIDLETDEVPKEQNLQEALRLKRPDYFARMKVIDKNKE